jgi:hypothetical protein
MKQIEPEFQTNANQTGVQIFRCIKTEVNPSGKNVYLYSRTKLDGKIFGYEIFIPQITKAGTVQTFPNGVTRTIEDDTENYPGASAFGKTAHFCIDMENAEKKFTQMMGQIEVEEESVEEVVEESPIEVPKAIKLPRGKKPEILIPVGEFSIDQLAQHNDVSYATARNGLQFFLQSQVVVLAKEQRMGDAKRATKFFKKV